jgi:high-affinity nickel-transport protein
VIGLAVSHLNLRGPVWGFVGVLNDNFGSLGYLIIAIFITSWIISIAIYRINRYDAVEIRTTQPVGPTAP